MRALLVGSGGREHALAWKLTQDGHEALCAPGNGGTRLMRLRHLDVAVEDVPELVRSAVEERVELVVVGPEAPLALGLVDALAERGIPAFGPTRTAARIETDKAWAKAFFHRHAIPTAAGASFRDMDAALRFVDGLASPPVVKAAGLAAGKGVVVCDTLEEAHETVRDMLGGRRFGEAAAEIVVEERLEGRECSLMAFVAGEQVLPLAPARDYKRACDGDRGPMTGGMGAYSPVPDVPPALADEIVRTILRPVAAGLVAEGCPFRGLLYAGLMLTPDRPKVLECNARFGDPETQVLLPRLDDDLGALCLAAATGRLPAGPLRWRPETAVCVVLTAEGYPGAYGRGLAIAGLDSAAAEPGVHLFHAGTALEHSFGDAPGRASEPGGPPAVGARSAGGPPHIVSAGGRVLNVVALAADRDAARTRAYAACKCIRMPGARFRTDIAAT